MRVHVGTSGYAYPEWKGSFYPRELPARGFLAYYSRQLPTVEINNTFYRMPSEKTMLGWAGDVPEDFVFALKAPQKITHLKRLREAGEDFRFFARMASLLEGRRGPTLVQLPPTMKKDLPRLEAFVQDVPPGWRAAFEFRHPSWDADDVYDLLRSRDLALVAADTGEGECPVVATADWGYLRLRKVEYAPEELAAWSERVLSQPWTDAFVYFKHEDGATGPRLAADFRGRVGAS